MVYKLQQDQLLLLYKEKVFMETFTDIIRARVGQFTPTGRLLTAGKRIYTRSSMLYLKMLF